MLEGTGPDWTGPPLPPRWSSTAHPVFVGRAQERAVLDEVWQHVVRGSRQVVLVGGEPGAGKSRLLAEVAAHLHEQGAAVLLGSCREEFGPPYQPFVQPLDALVPDLLNGRLPLGEPGDEEVSSLVDRLLTLSGSGPARSGVAEQRRLLYDAAVAAFRAAAAQRPLVLVLEDLHWAGSTALQLLGHLVTQTEDARILLLATHRTTAPDRSRPLAAALASLYRLDGVRRLDLKGLDVEDVADYLVREGGLPSWRAHAAAGVLRDQTGGNPFYLRELWRDLARRAGGLQVDALESVSAPESVRHTIDSRLDRLDAPHRQVLELAAVLGEELDPTVLLAASDWTPETTLEAIDVALDFGFLEPVPGPDSTFRFSHALARQAVLDQLSWSRRAHEHACIAQVLERRFPESERHVQQLAHHFAGAVTLGFRDTAVRYLIKAAGVADRSLAHDDAARCLEQAASLTDDPDERNALLLAASRSHLLGGNFARARELAERVATEGPARLKLRAAVAFEAAAWRPGHSGQRSVELLTAALAAMDRRTSDPEYVRGLASLGRALAFTGSAEQASSLGDRALELAEALGDDELLADALQASLWQGVRPTDAARTLARADRLSALAYRTGDLGQLGPAAYFRGAIAYLHGDPEDMNAAYADLVRTARATGQTFYGYMAGCMEYGRHFMAGEFASAERTCRSLMEMGVSFGTDDTEGPYGVQTYLVRREEGHLDQVRRFITGEENPTDHWAPGLLALYTEFGLTGPASRLLHWLLDHQLSRYQASAQWPGVLAFLVEAAVSLQDADSARRLRGPLSEFAGLNLLAGQFIALFGSADRYLATVDALLGIGSPEERFASALALDKRMGAPVHQALTLAAHAGYLQRRGTAPRRVAEMADRVRELALPLGHVRALRQVERLPLGTGAGERRDGLTDRETEVLRLLAEGLSNRDIASRLVISENTAANHVRSILAKTGSENRTQAAIYAAHEGLLVEPVRVDQDRLEQARVEQVRVEQFRAAGPIRPRRESR